MPTHRTVLVIAADSTDAHYGKHLQQDRNWSYQILTAPPTPPLLSLTQQQRIDGILLELRSPADQANLLPHLQKQLGDRCPPIVVIGKGDVEMAVQALKQGAVDYLVQDRLTPEALQRAMGTAIANAELRQELERSQERFHISVETMLDCFGIFTALRDAAGEIVDFRVDYLNRAACEINQMPPEAQLGRGLCELLPGHRESGLFEEYCQVVETGQPLIKDSLTYADQFGEQRLVRAFDIRAARLNDGFVASWRDITDRKQLEVEIHQLNQELTNRVTELQTLLDILPVGIAIASDPNCLTMQSNAYIRHLLQVNPGDKISKSLPDDGQPPYRVFQDGQEIPADALPMQMSAREGIDVREVELDVRLPNGTERQLLSYATPLWDEQQQIRGAIGAFLDITDRNRAIAALKASQERYRDLAEAMPQIVWTADAQGSVTYWNRRWYEYTGLQVENSLGLAGVDQVHPEDRDRTLTLWNQAIAQETELEIEYRIRGWDGTYRWFISRAIPTRDRQGQVTGWIGTITDIDHQKHLEERFQLVLQAVNGLVFDWNLQTNEVYRSEQLYELIGIHPNEAPASATWWHERIHPDDAARLRPQMQELFAGTGELCESEYRIRHADGHWVHVWDRSYLVRDRQGQVIRIVGSTVDISDRKRAAATLRDAHIQLEAALAAGSIYTWRWNILENRVTTNRSFAHLFGVDPDGAVAGLPIEQFLNGIHPGDRTTVIAAIKRAIATGEPYIAEFRIQTQNDEDRWVIARGQVEYDANGIATAFPGALADITERKQAELERQRSDAMLQAFMEAAPVTLALFDRDLRFLYANEALARINNLPLQEHLGRTLWDVVPDLAAQFAPLLQGLMDTQEPVLNVEFSGEVRPGVFRSTIANHYPVCLSNGEVIGVGVAVMDVTALALAQRELRDSEERFRTLADNISQFAWMADETGWIFWYNQRWLDYTGTTLDEMQGWGWQQVHHPDYVAQVVREFRRCIETGNTWEDTFPLRGKDGQYRWFLSRAIPVRDAEGQVQRWFGTNTDITDRKQAEEALRQSEERYRCLAESIPQLVWTAASDGTLLDVNQRWTEFTGLTLSQAKTTPWDQVVHPDDVPALLQQWTQAVNQGIPYQAEGRMRQANGEYRWHLHQAVPQRDGQGQGIKWFGTATDIEAQKQLELERNRLLQRERSTREEAERANRIKDEFLAVLSHELRSPLNPILGWTKLLQIRQFDADQTAQALTTIERNARLQAQLIDDLLDIAKILRGKLSLNLDQVNLDYVIEAAIETVKTAAIAKSITLHPVLLPLGPVSGDAARLQQVVWNLLSNAIKFTPPGGHVHIGLEPVGNQAQITVSDTGKGINPAFLPHIFESFRQEDASTTRQYGGLGLGLAIVRQLVEAHGGTITATSPGEGQGATFTIQLPLLHREPPRPPKAPPLQADLNLSGIHILAVDDDPDARELLAVLLTQYGATVHTVASAADVLDALGSFQPDVLVSDIGMPGTDGYTLLHQIRTQDWIGKPIPAIALTAYARDEDHQRALRSGFQQHLSKPLDPEQLIQAIIALVRPVPSKG